MGYMAELKHYVRTFQKYIKYKITSSKVLWTRFALNGGTTEKVICRLYIILLYIQHTQHYRDLNIYTVA